MRIQYLSFEEDNDLWESRGILENAKILLKLGELSLHFAHKWSRIFSLFYVAERLVSSVFFFPQLHEGKCLDRNITLKCWPKLIVVLNCSLEIFSPVFSQKLLKNWQIIQKRTLIKVLLTFIPFFSKNKLFNVFCTINSNIRVIKISYIFCLIASPNNSCSENYKSKDVLIERIMHYLE